MICKNERGVALPLVLVVVAALTLLGFALMMYSVGETADVARDEKRMKAHYLARSGAHAVAMHLIENPEIAEGLISAPTSEEVTSLGDGVFVVNIYGDLDLDTIYIESTGTVGDAVQSVVVTVTRIRLFDTVLYADDITIAGNAAEIYGDVVYGTAVNIHTGIIKDGTLTPEEREYPDADFPDIAYTIEDIIKRSDTIDRDTRCDNIELTNRNHVLTVELGQTEADYKDISLVVQNFSATGGQIVLNGHGRLLLFIHSFDASGNFSTVSPYADIVLFVSTNGTFELSGGANFEGAVYAPTAEFRVASGTPTINGSIITGRIISGSGGNPKIYYKEINTVDLPIKLYRLGTWRY